MADIRPKTVIYTASGKWESGMLVNSAAGSFTDILTDMPESSGGTDMGPRPLDYILTSLIGCAGGTLSVLAKRSGFEYTGFTGEAQGILDLGGFLGVPGVSKHFTSVSAIFIVETDESKERVKEICSLVEEKCPVLNLLADAGVKLEIEWKIADLEGA